MKRKLTLAEAKAWYPHRFTMEHVPAWARRPMQGGRCYAPQYRTDQEWYDNTIFPGEGHIGRTATHCESSNPTWPLGQFLDTPYMIQKVA